MLGIEDAGRAFVIEALVPEDLDHRAIGGDVALHDDESTGRLDRVLDRDDDILTRGFDRVGSFLGEGATAGGFEIASEQAARDHALGDERGATGGIEIGGGVLAARHHVADERGALRDDIEIVDRQRDVALLRQGEEVEHGIGRATAGGDTGDRVFEGVAGEDIARADAGFEQIHDELTGAATDLHLAGIDDVALGALASFLLFIGDGRGGGAAERRETDEFHRHGHGVGGVLTTARAVGRAGVILDELQFFVADLAGLARADRLIDGADGRFLHLAVDFDFAGEDGAAIDKEAGDVEAGETDGETGQGFVAGAETDDGIEHVTAADEFD